MSILTTQQTETTGSPFMNTSRSLLMLIGISSGTGLVLINILLIACCLHKRHRKNLKGGKGPVAHVGGIIMFVDKGFTRIKARQGGTLPRLELHAAFISLTLQTYFFIDLFYDFAIVVRAYSMLL